MQNKRTKTQAPCKLSSNVLAFCRSINATFTPEYLVPKPGLGCEVGECYFNVEKTLAACDGEGVFGWLIWERPKVFLEAEHHRIFIQNGKLIDVTPPVEEDSRVLFLRDPDRAVDFEAKEQIPNIQHFILNDPAVHEFFAAAEHIRELFGKKAGATVSISKSELSKRYIRLQRADAQLTEKQRQMTGRNEPCICGSCKKYKLCCL